MSDRAVDVLDGPFGVAEAGSMEHGIAAERWDLVGWLVTPYFVGRWFTEQDGAYHAMPFYSREDALVAARALNAAFGS